MGSPLRVAALNELVFYFFIQSMNDVMTKPLMILAAYFFACICGQESDGQGTGVHKHWDYIVIGGGPAGLQLGHFLKKSNRDYVIMERNGIPGEAITHSA